MATFIFGFGSLISAESRKRTGESGAAYACIVQGLERSWSHRVTLPEGPARPNPAIAGVSAVSVHAREGSTTNGVVVKVEESELPKYDEREIGYDRIPVDVAHVALCSEESVIDVLGADANVWVYVGAAATEPSANFPVIQSYLDVILLGCKVTGGAAFVADFLRTTVGWGSEQGCFVDDRDATPPGYVRASADALALREEWDAAIKAQQPAAFEARRVFTAARGE